MVKIVRLAMKNCAQLCVVTLCVSMSLNETAAIAFVFPSRAVRALQVSTIFVPHGGQCAGFKSIALPSFISSPFASFRGKSRPPNNVRTPENNVQISLNQGQCTIADAGSLLSCGAYVAAGWNSWCASVGPIPCALSFKQRSSTFRVDFTQPSGLQCQSCL